MCRTWLQRKTPNCNKLVTLNTTASLTRMQKWSHKEIIMRRNMNVALWQFSISAFIDNLDAGWRSQRLAQIQCHMQQKAIVQRKPQFPCQKYSDSNCPLRYEYFLWHNFFCSAEVQQSESRLRDIFRSIAIKIFAFLANSRHRRLSNKRLNCLRRLQSFEASSITALSLPSKHSLRSFTFFTWKT